MVRGDSPKSNEGQVQQDKTDVTKFFPHLQPCERNSCNIIPLPRISLDHEYS